ncbi:MAG: peptide/nickel transport system permease protein [Actinomycetota bacterium]|jgi:peptide/nickel transport system permease protein|nr:peptide/nickel transport system permease protein [Actinomycetota bacterium]
MSRGGEGGAISQLLTSGPETSAPLAGEITLGRSPAQISWLRFRRDHTGMVSAGVVLFFILVAILAPLISKVYGKTPYITYGQNSPGLLDDYGFPAGAHGGISSQFWLGLEPSLGRDTFMQLVYGARTSLLIAGAAALITTTFGVLYGIVTAYLGGWVDSLGGRIMDVVYAFPALLFIIAFSPVVESLFVKPDQETPSWLRFSSIIFLLSVLGWVYQARLIRGQVLSLREREFVDAARMSGASSWRIVRHELLPNLWSPILVTFSLTLPALITTEAALAFLGVGIVEPIPDWGRMINRGAQVYTDDLTYMVFPGLALFLLVLCFNLLGDSVRDALDPKSTR